MKNTKKFDYGRFLIEYRNDSGGPLFFVKKKIDDIDVAMKEANMLKDRGYSDVMIRQNVK